MSGVNQSFTMYAGDTKKIYVEVVTSKGVPVDLTEATAIWVLNSKGIEVLRKVSPSQILFTEPTKGKLTIFLESDDTKGLRGDYTHAMQVVNSVGEVYTVLEGTVVLRDALVK